MKNYECVMSISMTSPIYTTYGWTFKYSKISSDVSSVTVGLASKPLLSLIAYISWNLMD